MQPAACSDHGLGRWTRVRAYANHTIYHSTLLRTNTVRIPAAEPCMPAAVGYCGPELRNVALHRPAGGNEKVMRVLRFMILIIGMLGGAAGLSYATNAAPLPVSAATATQAGEAL